MKEILLTHGFVTLVDDEDFEWLSQWRWAARENQSGTFYAVRYQVHRVIQMHRVIMEAPKELEVDHKNGDALDNRRCNLRLCTHQQNMHNRKLSKNNTSGYKGISFRKRSQKWYASINVFIGSYDTSEEAARAYDTKAIELFGEFAKPNFPRRVARR